MFLCFELETYKVACEYKRKHNEKLNDELHKTFIEKLWSHIKMLIICMIPILNLILFFYIVFRGVKVKEIEDQLKQE